MTRAHASLFKLPLAVSIAALISVSVVTAQDDAAPADSETSVEFNLLSIEGLVVGSTITIDAAFGAENQIDVPAPFSFLVPTADDVRELLDPAPQPGQALVKVNFATMDRELIENLQFVPYTLALEGDLEARMNTLAGMVAEDAFQMAVGTYEDHTRDLVRAVDINGLPAVEVIGRYQDPNLGLMYLRIVGILNPDSEHSVVAISNVVAARQAIPTPNDFPQTRSGTALKNFQFLSAE